MNITQLEKEIVKAIKIENKGLKDLLKFVRKCFKEHKEE